MVIYLPAEKVTAWLGHGMGAIPLAVAIGIPSYLNGYAALPLASGLINLGMSQAVALAFLVGGGVTSVPAMVVVWALVKPNGFALYMVLALLGSHRTGGGSARGGRCGALRDSADHSRSDDPSYGGGSELEGSDVYSARSGQSALFVKCSQARPLGHLRLEVGPGSGKIVDQHFVARAGQSTDPQDDARKVFADLEINNALHERERLRRIVDCISAKFQYQHDFRSDEPLTCDLLTGNCLDINAALVKLLRLAGIRHATTSATFSKKGNRSARAIAG